MYAVSLATVLWVASPGAAPHPPEANLSAFDESVGYGTAYFQDLWQRRQQALNRGDFRQADTFLQTLLDAKQRSGWPDLLIVGEALAAESRGALTARDPVRAMELARLATQVAPHRLATWQAHASACWAGGQVGRGTRALARGASLLLNEAPYAWTLQGNFACLFCCGLVAAAAALALSCLYRHWIPLCHQVGHWLPAGATAAQKGLLVGAVLLLPVFFRLGPCWSSVLWIGALVPFYGPKERSAAAGLLVCLGVMAATLGWTTAYLSFGNSRAERLYLTVRDIDGGQAALDLAAYPDPTPDELYALGLRSRWLGDLDRARSFLEKVEKTGDESGPGLSILLGNLRFLQGDTAASIARYDQALQSESNNVLALFNKSQVLGFMNDPASETLRRAAGNVDLDLVDRLSHYALRTGLRVVDPELPAHLLRGMTQQPSAMHDEAVRQIWRVFGGILSRWLLVVVALGGAAGMTFWGVRQPFEAKTRACERCGAPACRTCDPALPSLDACGACREAFGADVPIAQNRRITQEIESFRHRARQLEVQRVCNLLCAGFGQLLRGDILRGLFCVTLFVTLILEFAGALGLLPDPLPLYAAPPGMRRVAWLTAAVVVYIVAVVDGQREREF